MGNKPMKFRCDAPSRGNQRAEKKGDPVSPSASERSSSKVQATPQIHCTEVLIFHITPKENEFYTLVPSEEMEGERLRENFEKSGETPSVSMTSGSSEFAFGILKEDGVTPDLADSTTETLVKTDVQPIGLDFQCESCQLLLPDVSPTPSPETCKASSSAEHTSSCSSSKEEAAAELASVGTLSVGKAEPGKETKGLHPSSEFPKGTEVPESDQKGSCEMVLELTTDNSQRAFEEYTTGQRELGDEAAPEEALQRTAEPHPTMISAETPNSASIITAFVANEQLSEDQTLSVSEVEGEIPEECSAVGSGKEREDLCAPKEVSTETELQPNDQEVPYRMGLELPTENSQVAAEKPTTGQSRLDDEVFSEKTVDTESHIDSTLVETSGGTSSMGTAPRTKQLAEMQSIPGYDLPLAGTEVENKVSGNSSGTENMGETTKAVSNQLEMLPVEVQEKMLAQVDARNEITFPSASNTSLEKELEHPSTVQSFSTVEERPDSDDQVLGDAEFLDNAQLDEASPTLEATLPEVQVQAQPPAEVTMAQSSPKALHGAAETMKELQEASPDQPLAEETIEQAGSPEAQLPPETSLVPGTPLKEADGEEDAEFFDAADTYRDSEVPAWVKVLDAQEKHSGQDEPMQESPIGSPKLILE